MNFRTYSETPLPSALPSLFENRSSSNVMLSVPVQAESESPPAVLYSLEESVSLPACTMPLQK